MKAVFFLWIIHGQVNRKGLGDMELLINGQLAHIPGANTLWDVVNHYGLNEKMIVIEHNLDIVPREKYGITPVAPGDKIEIVHFVGGG